MRSIAKNRIGIENGFVIKGNFRRAVRLGAGRDQDYFCAQEAGRAVMIHGADSVRIFKLGRAGDQLDFMRGQVRRNLQAFRGDDRVLAVHEALHRQPFAQGVIDAVKTALPQSGKIERRFAQRLARHRPGIDARAAQIRPAFHKRHALAKVGRLRRAFLSGRPRADHYEV